ncbi:uncharacterized protein N7482_001050 [Penicillium canariense]|uniref:Uncharacterized protein n=1 Tax=Penicillium canariense TaxID=189055 RepID=A0A9W9LSJ8_9EURO|nr:uncharacterized protein N7482_001050 [Penicillium canariense]KAJ5175173.1 hypothetical protein N7482_001050 [Penicillium canariense]
MSSPQAIPPGSSQDPRDGGCSEKWMPESFESAAQHTNNEMENLANLPTVEPGSAEPKEPDAFRGFARIGAESRSTPIESPSGINEHRLNSFADKNAVVFYCTTTGGKGYR